MLGRSWVGRALLLLLGPFHQTTDAHGTHITSFEDVLSSQPHVHDFAVVSYVSVTSADGVESLAPNAPYPSSLHVHFRTSHGMDVKFDVRLKRNLFAADSFVWAHDGPELALLKSHKPHHIAYEGTLPLGYIRLTMFDRHTFHATIKLHDKIVVVDPVEHHKNAHQLTSPVTGMVAYSIPLEAATLSNEHHRQLTSTFGRMATCTWSARQITVGVVSDAGFTSEHGGAAKTQSYLIAVYNSINGLYDDQIGVHLTIGAFLIETAAGGAAWNVEPQTCGAMVDMNVQLNAVKSWVAAGEDVPLCNQENCGVWHLHTNCDADRTRTGNTAGLAWVGTLCSSSMGYNTGVSIDAGVNTWIVVGHEIGHNFGADHTFAEGGIMSYDWSTPTKFYDNGQVCSFVQSVLDKCLKPYSSDGAATARATTTTARPTTTAITTAQLTTTTARPTTTTSAGPATTTTTTTPLATTSTSTPLPQVDPCACSTENLCREVYRPGCQTFLDKRYCYVVGYDQCARAKPSVTCTNANGKTLYYLEFDGVCPTLVPSPSPNTPPVTTTPTTSTLTPTTTTLTPITTTLTPTTATPPSSTTTIVPTTTTTLTPTTATPTTTTTTVVPTTTTSSAPTPANTTLIPTLSNSTPPTTITNPPTTTAASSDPCSCSTDSKCPTIAGGGCQSFRGRSWCYVQDPTKCVGAAYYDSMDCVGQKYMQCNGSTNTLLPPPPKDPCACSTTVTCPSVSTQPGCFKSDRTSYCYVQDPTKCFGPSIRSSSVCAREKLRRCSSQDKSATHWIVNEWSKCSALCGGGVKTRTVACMDQKEIIEFTDSSCSTPKPVYTLECNVRSCPVTAFNNTTPCAGPPHSTCKPRSRKRLCDCACNLGYIYHPRRRECVPLPAMEMLSVKCPECAGNVRGPLSFEVRSHDIDPLEPPVCDGQDDGGTVTVTASWLVAFEPDSTTTSGDSASTSEGTTNVAMIAIATCIAAIALILVVLAYRRHTVLQPATQHQTPVYIVGSTPGAML